MIKNNQNLAVLTRCGSSCGINVLDKLASNKIKPRLVCVEKTTFGSRLKMAKFLSKKIGMVDAIIYNIRFWFKPILRLLSLGFISPNPDYSKYSEDVLYVGDINDKSVVSLLANPKINRIILAQSGIIRNGILNLPNKLIINCHPGNIPYYRGVDCIKWALFNEERIYITLHLIDSGIDTGFILEKKEVPIYKDDTTNTIEQRADEMCGDLLIKSTTMPEEFFKKATKVDKSKGRQYYLMPIKKVRQLKNKERAIINSMAHEQIQE